MEQKNKKQKIDLSEKYIEIIGQFDNVSIPWFLKFQLDEKKYEVEFYVKIDSDKKDEMKFGIYDFSNCIVKINQKNSNYLSKKHPHKYTFDELENIYQSYIAKQEKYAFEPQTMLNIANFDAKKSKFRDIINEATRKYKEKKENFFTDREHEYVSQRFSEFLKNMQWDTTYMQYVSNLTGKKISHTYGMITEIHKNMLIIQEDLKKMDEKINK